MMRVASLTIGIFASSLAGQTEPGARPEVASLEELLARMEAKEATPPTSVVLEMMTNGSLPDGTPIKVTGTMRVLGKTHLHVANTSRLDDQVMVEGETVRTPEGAWVREKGPAFGEVFYKIDPELLEKIKQAEAVIGGKDGAGFSSENPVGELRGAAMLRSRNEQFALEMKPAVIDGREYYVVSGPARVAAPPSTDAGVPAPDRIELLVRMRDLAVVETTEFANGKPLSQTKFTRLETDVPLEKSSFVIELPPGAQFVDAMQHPPARAAIEDMFERAAAKRAEAGGGAEPGDKGKGGA